MAEIRGSMAKSPPSMAEIRGSMAKSPPSMAEIRGSMAKTSFVDGGNSGIDAEDVLRRWRKFGDRWQRRPSSSAKIRGSVPKASFVDSGNWGIDAKDLLRRCGNSGLDVRASAIAAGKSNASSKPFAGVRRLIELMSATGHETARAPKGASGTCRDRRRPRGDRRRWVRPFHRASHALYASQRLICATLHSIAAAKRAAHRRPVRASRTLYDASELLVTASVRLMKAVENIAEMTQSACREPETAEPVPEILVQTTERWVFMTSWLAETSNEVFALHRSILEGLQAGTLVPEQPASRRPRIVLAPRPVPVRAFLRLRQPRVCDRIASILLRRRRIPRPAALRVPRRNVLGRAPPLFSVCLL
jgi:hypothetical protein